MRRSIILSAAMAVALPALAAPAPRAPASGPALSAAKIVDASAAGAVVVATCGHGSADMHRRNAQASARDMLQARHMLPADFDARFMRAWSRDTADMRKLTPAQRATVCKRLEAQGMRFRN